MAQHGNGDDEDEVRQTTVKTEIQTGLGELEGDILARAERFDPALVVIQGELLGNVFRLHEGSTLVGRNSSNQIVLNQRTVSGKHAEFVNDKKSVILNDLGSANGTVVNRLRINKPVLLNPGDLVKIGGYVFKYLDKQIDSQLAEFLHTKGAIDGLTGAFNKEHVLKALSSSIEIAKGGYPLSLIVIDLDHFKKINDTFGHIAGDIVLKETCHLVRDNVLRGEDVLGRFGGEEFVVIMPDTNGQNAAAVAERIRISLQVHSFEFEGQRIPVTASLGVCEWNPKFKTAEDFIHAADQLLYKSKQQGRNRVTKG